MDNFIRNPNMRYTLSIKKRIIQIEEPSTKLCLIESVNGPEFRGFEHVVKLSGKQLAPAIYKFILHMEESEREATQATQEKKKSVDSNTLKSKVLKETRLIPKVIYEIEQFSKSVIQLSNKTKVDLNKYVGQGIVRDFRIMELKKVLGGTAENATQSTQADRSTVTEEESDEEVEEEDDSGPPSKKSRL